MSPPALAATPALPREPRQGAQPAPLTTTAHTHTHAKQRFAVSVLLACKNTVGGKREKKMDVKNRRYKVKRKKIKRTIIPLQ